MDVGEKGSLTLTPSEKKQKGKSLNTSICPLCGEPNQCAMAADLNAKSCWCEAVEFPEGLLALIPEKAIRKSCVCKKCLEKYKNRSKHESSYT